MLQCCSGICDARYDVLEEEIDRGPNAFVGCLSALVDRSAPCLEGLDVAIAACDHVFKQFMLLSASKFGFLLGRVLLEVVEASLALLSRLAQVDLLSRGLQGRCHCSNIFLVMNALLIERSLVGVAKVVV